MIFDYDTVRKFSGIMANIKIKVSATQQFSETSMVKQVKLARSSKSKKSDIAIETLKNWDDAPEPGSNSASGYFEEYASFRIHSLMLNDQVRTTTYRDAILCSKDLFKVRIIACQRTPGNHD